MELVPIAVHLQSGHCLTAILLYFLSEVHFCRAMLCKRGLCRHAVSVCPSVRMSDTFMDHIKTNKRIIKVFSPSGSTPL